MASFLDSIVLAFSSSFLFLTPLVFPVIALIGVTKAPLISVPLLIAYFGYCYLEGSEKKNGKPWKAFTEKYILFDKMRKYFPLRFHLCKELNHENMDGKEQFIFAIHPHGTCSDYRIIMDGMISSMIPKLKSWRVLAAGILFKLPIIRQFCLWTHCVDASRNVASRILSKGHSVMVVPGGEHEQLLTENGKEILYLKRRKGFVRLAIKYGVPLVPVYVFGCSDLYHTSNFLFGIRFWIMKNMRICLPIFWGKFGLLCPFDIPLDMVFGEPIDVGMNQAPTPEEIDNAHAKYMLRLKELFDKNKELFGYGDRELQIL